MIVVQYAGSPFDDRTLLEVESDDGVLTAIYVSNHFDETASLVFEYPGTLDETLLQRFERLRALGVYSERTVILHQD